MASSKVGQQKALPAPFEGHQRCKSRASLGQKENRQKLSQKLNDNKKSPAAFHCQATNVSHTYNAIKLTNYYSNLLEQQSQTTLGETWRAQQLAYQIPHQDIKLLAAPKQHQNGASSAELTCEPNGSGQSQERLLLTSSNQQKSNPAASLSSSSPSGAMATSVEEEIEFIRSQRRMASQFRASLYYLNPTGNCGSQQAASSSVANSQIGSPNRQPQCFKASIWFGRVFISIILLREFLSEISCLRFPKPKLCTLD